MPSARQATGTVVGAREAGIFVEVLQKGEITNATLYFQTIQKLRHAVPDKPLRHKKASCNKAGSSVRGEDS